MMDTGYLVYLQYRLEKMGQEIIKEELAGNHQEAKFLKDDYEMLQSRIRSIENA